MKVATWSMILVLLGGCIALGVLLYQSSSSLNTERFRTEDLTKSLQAQSQREEQLLAELESVKTSRADLTATSADLAQQLNDSKQREVQLRAELEDAKAMRAALTSASADLNQELAESKRRETLLRSELDAATTSQRRTADAVAELTQRLNESSEQVRSLSAELDSARRTQQQVSASGEQRLAVATEYSKRMVQHCAALLGSAMSLVAVREQETLLHLAPSGQAFSAYRSKLDQLIRSLSLAESSVGSTKGFLRPNLNTLRTIGLATDEDLVALDQIQSTFIQPALTTARQSLSTAQSFVYDVISTEGWQSTEIRVNAGDILNVTASGQWVYAPNASPTPVGPQGEWGNSSYRIVQGLPNGALLIRVRGTDAVYSIASPVQVPRAGTIEMRINDTVLSDNRGSMKVNGFVTRPMRWQ